MDTTYFLIAPESPVMLVVHEFEEKQRQFGEAIIGIRDKYGAKEVHAYGRRSFAGLKFDGNIPKGWRQRKDGISVPDTRTKAGKEVREEVNAIPRGFDPWSFSSALGEAFLHFGDGKVYFSTVGQFGDKYVLCVPAPCKVQPEGCTELKTSEYWQIREAETACKDAA